LNSKLIECNQATVELYGCTSKDEIIGKQVFNFFGEEQRKRSLATPSDEDTKLMQKVRVFSSLPENRQEQLLERISSFFGNKKIALQMIKFWETGTARNIEQNYRRIDGREFPCEYSVSTVKDYSGKPIWFCSCTGGHHRT
jgi:PAS domain-containing protein